MVGCGMASIKEVEAFLAERRTVIVGGTRKDGRPHLSPNWFFWDGTHFYVSTTKRRVKYAIFRRDPRAQLVIDDATGHRTVFVPATVEVRQDLATNLSYFRAIRDKHGLDTPGDVEFQRMLAEEERVLLVFTPDKPISEWTTTDLD